MSRTDDPTSATGVDPVEGSWPDLLFANPFERPMDPDGTYRPDLGLAAVEAGVQGEWVYATLRRAGPQAHGSGGHYSVEFDTDLDGCPDALVLAWPTAADTWSSSNMRAYLDADKNVGGNRPRLAEAPVAEWDGFEAQREDATTTRPQSLVWDQTSTGESSVL